jgi:hypothetical protein
VVDPERVDPPVARLGDDDPYHADDPSLATSFKPTVVSIRGGTMTGPI